MILQDALEAYLSSLVDRRLSAKAVTTNRNRLGCFVFGDNHEQPNRSSWPLTAVSAHHIHEHFLALRLAGLASGTLAGYKSAHRYH